MLALLRFMLKSAASKVKNARDLYPRAIYHQNVIKHLTIHVMLTPWIKLTGSLELVLFLAPDCGNVMKLQIKVDQSINQSNDGDMIVDAKFKTFGCGSAIASSSLSTGLVKGKKMNEASKIRNMKNENV